MVAMNSSLSQLSAALCFDQLTGSIRPQWESGPTSAGQKQSHSIERLHTGTTIAVHAHVYYIELLPELIQGWDLLADRHLLINTNSRTKARIIQTMLLGRGEDRFEIRIMPNRGRDIAAMLVGWRDEILNYDILVHCHTKLSPYTNSSFGTEWRRGMINGCFPSNSQCYNFLNILSLRKSGFIMPWPHRHVAHNVNWGGNYSRTESLMMHMGYPIKRHTLLQFPAGSFFWARVDALRPLFDLKLHWSDFSTEPLPRDGTLAHALERCLGLIPTLKNRFNYAYWDSEYHPNINNKTTCSGIVALPTHEETQNITEALFAKGLKEAFNYNSRGRNSILV